MKKVVLCILTFVFSKSIAQQVLQKQFYTEITMLGAGIGYDYPLSERFMSEISTGMSFSVLALSEKQLIAIVPKFFRIQNCV